MHQKLCGLWDSVHQHIDACSQLTAGSSIGELSDTHKHKIVSATNKTVWEVSVCVWCVCVCVCVCVCMCVSLVNVVHMMIR